MLSANASWRGYGTGRAALARGGTVVLGVFLVAGVVTVVYSFAGRRPTASLLAIRGADCRPDADPQIVHLDLSPARVGDLLARRVVLVNPAPTAAIIRDVRASCECVRVSPDRFTISPGESRPLEVVVDLRGDDSAPGLFGPIVEFIGRDGALIALQLHVEIRPAGSGSLAADSGRAAPDHSSRR